MSWSRIDAERFLLHGRLADLVNIAGKRSSLAYLTHQLNSIAGVEDGVFFFPEEPQPSQAGVARVAAAVVAPGLDAARLTRGAAPADRSGLPAAAPAVRGAAAAQQHGQAAARGAAVARRGIGCGGGVRRHGGGPAAAR